MSYIRNISGVPTETRTPVTAVKGRCPRPLDDRDTDRKHVNKHKMASPRGLEPRLPP